MSKVKIIPELRFPEFEKDGEWEINEFGELINILADFTANGSFASLKENVTYYSSEEYAVLVRTTDLDKKIFTPARFTDKRGYEFLSKTSLFGNEIVMANVGSIGKVFRVPNYDKPMTLAPNTYVLKFNDFVDEDFIYQLMLRAEFEKKLLSMVGSSTLMAINKSNLRSIKVSIPAKIEQQKIASCLSFLDEIIATHSQKLNLLKDHKKGMMQNLFPQEGEKVPKYRFKEFENDGEWVEKTLGDITENLDSKRIPITSTQREKGSVPYYGASGIIDFVKDYIFDETLLCISEDGANLIDRNYPIAFTISGKTWVNNHSHVLRFENFDTQILVEKYINSINIQDFLTGMAQPKLNRGKLDIIPIPLPKNPKEQQKIASCLSSLDALITAQTERMEQLKLHKKGLMQGLFPKIEI
jgi:type I restriction enzyme S subunit